MVGENMVHNNDNNNNNNNNNNNLFHKGNTVKYNI